MEFPTFTRMLFTPRLALPLLYSYTTLSPANANANPYMLSPYAFNKKTPTTLLCLANRSHPSFSYSLMILVVCSYLLVLSVPLTSFLTLHHPLFHNKVVGVTCQAHNHNNNTVDSQRQRHPS